MQTTDSRPYMLCGELALPASRLSGAAGSLGRPGPPSPRDRARDAPSACRAHRRVSTPPAHLPTWRPAEMQCWRSLQGCGLAWRRCFREGSRRPAELPGWCIPDHVARDGRRRRCLPAPTRRAGWPSRSRCTPHTAGRGHRQRRPTSDQNRRRRSRRSGTPGAPPVAPQAASWRSAERRRVPKATGSAPHRVTPGALRCRQGAAGATSPRHPSSPDRASLHCAGRLRWSGIATGYVPLGDLEEVLGRSM